MLDRGNNWCGGSIPYDGTSGWSSGVTPTYCFCRSQASQDPFSTSSPGCRSGSRLRPLFFQPGKRGVSDPCHIPQPLNSWRCLTRCSALACPRRDTEMLAQRLAKRAKTSTGDEASASTVGAPETIVISPEPSSQCNLEPSPQRESTTHFPLASIGEIIFTIDITGLVGEGR